MNRHIVEEFCGIVGRENVQINVPMNKYTTFKVGGPAAFFITPESAGQIKILIQVCNSNNIPYFIMGNGSNLLVKDTGYSGLIIQLGEKFADCTVEGNIIKANAGIMLPALAKIACAHSISGLEFASGIPGTLGGTVTMNAGAYGGEMKDIVHSALVMDRQGEVKALTGEQLEFGYRKSIISKNNDILLEVSLCLKKGKMQEIKELMKELSAMRRKKQPLEYPSAGSTFKRPKGHFAGKLIMDSGLAGYKVGGAQVSTKHCGFVINLGNATAMDILTLIQEIKDRVYEKFGVVLEQEVKILG